MHFAHKKGYITDEKFKSLKEGFEDNEQGAEENFEVIFGSDEEYEPYCIAYEDESSEKSHDEQYAEALLVYGELICSKEEYYQAFLDKLQSKQGNLKMLEVIVK